MLLSRRPWNYALPLAVLAAAMIAPAAAQAPAKARASLEQRAGVWVEGPGYDVTYGGTYETCAARCLGASQCVMIEFYRPERKCNLYSSMRPLKKGGSSLVGLRAPEAR